MRMVTTQTGLFREKFPFRKKIFDFFRINCIVNNLVGIIPIRTHT